MRTVNTKERQTKYDFLYVMFCAILYRFYNVENLEKHSWKSVTFSNSLPHGCFSCFLRYCKWYQIARSISLSCSRTFRSSWQWSSQKRKQLIRYRIFNFSQNKTFFIHINPFYATGLFLHPLKTSKNLTSLGGIERYFQGVLKETSGMKWVKSNSRSKCKKYDEPPV